MKLSDYIETILASAPEDWERIFEPNFSDGHDRLMVLKTNLDISVALRQKHLDDFQEPWAQNFPDKRATSHFVDMLWKGRPVRRMLRVSVDGGRCGLPVPLVGGTMFVPRDQARFFGLVEEVLGGHEFDSYMKRAGIDVVSQPWA